LGGDFSGSGGTFSKNPGDATALIAENLQATRVFLRGASIDGKVDLSGANLSSGLAADGGKFRNHCDVALNAESLKAVSVSLRNVSADGEVDLKGATLGGDLDGEGGKFSNPGGHALNAENLTAASVFLNSDLAADGEVDLTNAALSGSLEADGGTFKNRGGYALKAESLKATNVFFKNGFGADGEVDLRDAALSGNLEANGGTFKNQGKYALSADRLRATSVYLNNHFSADGEVGLAGASLSGQLSADGGMFENPGGLALNAENIKAAGVFLRDGFTADGEVDLSGATLSGALSGQGGTFKNPGKVAVGAEELNTTSSVDFRDFGPEGTLNFAAADVKDAFFWMTLAPADTDKIVLDLRHAAVGLLLDDEESWPRQGNLHLDGFVYGRIDDARVHSSSSDALSRLAWLNLQRPKDNQSYDFTPQPYEQLAKALRENGDDAGANTVLIAMEEEHEHYEAFSVLRLFLRWTIGYGYDLSRAALLAVCFVILGTFLLFWGHRSGAIVQIDKEKPEQLFSFNPFIYSLETFLPLVELHQAKHWGPDPELRQLRPLVPIGAFWPLSKFQHRLGPAFGKRLRYYLWFHIVMGWFFGYMLIRGVAGLAHTG
jgi:hypothetical protein